ncbi:hypothetical protein CPB85DRAFT_754881 [Mucidula mucida]|nr:hypothetical protein CPB85DRAFT_754881 [Mucidula mucida]
MSSGQHAPLAIPLEGEPQKKRVCYFYDPDIGGFHYGAGHFMKPTRIRMCHSLVMNYGLYKKMEIFRAKPASKREMSQFHSEAYIEFLHRITPEHVRKGTSKVSAPPGDRTAEVYDCIRASLHPAPLFSVAATQACHDIRRRRNLDAGARPMPEVEVSPLVFLQHWQDNISV